MLSVSGQFEFKFPFNFQAKPTLNDQHLLKNFFFNPSFLRDPRAIDELLVGLTLTPVQRADDHFANDVSTYTLRVRRKSGRYVG